MRIATYLPIFNGFYGDDFKTNGLMGNAKSIIDRYLDLSKDKY